MTTDHAPTTSAGTSKISSEEPVTHQYFVGIEDVVARCFGSINVRLNVQFIVGGVQSMVL